MLNIQAERNASLAAARGERKQKGVEEHIGLVHFIARQFFGRGLSRTEVVQSGMLGLVEAWERFDPEYDTRFSTYAAPWIREKIRTAVYVKENGRIFHLPGDAADQVVLVKWALFVFQRKNNRWPTEEELLPVVHSHGTQTAADMKIAHLRVCLRLITEQVVELDALASSEEEGPLLAEIVRDERNSPEDTAIAEELFRISRAALDEVEDVVRSFSNRDAAILRHHVGLNGADVTSHAELGRRYGVTRQAIHQSCARSFRIIQRKLKVTPKALRQLIDAADELERMAFAVLPSAGGSRAPIRGASAVEILLHAGYLQGPRILPRKRTKNGRKA